MADNITNQKYTIFAYTMDVIHQTYMVFLIHSFL